MLKAIIRFLMKIYLRLRKLWDPIIIPTKTRDNYKCNMQTFFKRINMLPYKADPLKGLLDHTADPDTFFDDKESGRDCDDWARVASWWGVFHDYKAKEWVICDPSSIRKAFNTMHVITTLSKEDKYYLINYKPQGPFESEEEALNYMQTYLSFQDNRVIVFYREIKLEDGELRHVEAD